MKKIILTYCHYMGWGDSMISIYDILNCADYLKKKYSDISLTLVINDIRNNDIENILSKILDLEFFNVFFTEFKIQIISFEEFNNYGNMVFNGEKYKRIYSGRNIELNNNTPGIYDAYVDYKNFEEIQRLNIPFEKFTFNDDGNDVNNFPIFNKEIMDNVDRFIEKNFKDEFLGICYRSQSNSINYDNLNEVKSKIQSKFDINKEYFLCSNSSECKKIIKETKLNIKLFRDVNEHSKNHILDGISVGEQKIFDSICSVCEMIILSKCDKIFYSGEMNWISYFTWYGRNVGKKELILINNK
jgi:hypothetical protein